MIIGVSSKYDFGRWEHCLKIFNDGNAANKWLNTEEYDFRERELFNIDIIEYKISLIKLIGVEAYARAVAEHEGLDYNASSALMWTTLKEFYNMTFKKMSTLTGISERTLQKWAGGERVPPEYMIDLVLTKIKSSEEDLGE